MSAHGDLLADALVELSTRRCFVWRHPTGTARSMDPPYHPISYGLPGSSDIVGMLPGGRFLGVEIKVGRDRQRDTQRAFEARVRQVGGLYVVVRDLDQLRAVLDGGG